MARRTLSFLLLLNLAAFAQRPPRSTGIPARISLRGTFRRAIRGMVRFNGLPVPGAAVTAVPDSPSTTRRLLSTITQADGSYLLPHVPSGVWHLSVTMTGFASQQRVVTVSPASATTVQVWNLVMLPMGRTLPATNSGVVLAQAQPVRAVTSSPASSPTSPPNGPAAGAAPLDDLNHTAQSAFLVNGSEDNGAASPYFQLPAFGNNRRGQNSLYNGSIGGIFDLSALDASPFSLSGQKSPKPAYLHGTGLVQVGGPLLIPGIFNTMNAPMMFVAYQMVRSRNDSNASGRVPSLAERAGNLSSFSGAINNPATGQPFAGNQIPAGDISPQAAALLSLYPLPNVAQGPFNYQVPIVSIDHEDHLQLRLMKPLNRSNQVAGDFSMASVRSSAPNLFGFLDSTGSLGLNASLQWRHSFTARFGGTLTGRYSRMRIRQTPYFANRTNVSGLAGIQGNDQTPANWGPPSLSFSGGVSPLSDQLPANNRNQTSSIGYQAYWNHGDHNLLFGGDFSRLEFNFLQQQNPRGSFTFNGAATGNDWADFLLGIPDAASVAFGNADKYFRESGIDAFVEDDWRIASGLTLNTGFRWEYTSPITELYGRLVNLDVAAGFTAAAPVVASAPSGALTGQTYPASLLRPDYAGFEPRIGLAWRPFAASSTLVRLGYGIYRNTSVYQTIATQMAQQAPLSVSLNLAGNTAQPLSMATAFASPAGNGSTLFGVDPNFRIGNVQTWSASIQQDLPAATVMLIRYEGNKGTHEAQEFLPNTWAPGAANPCPACPSGFTYLASGGNSNYEAGTLELRRRFTGGLAAELQYTWSKAIDDASPGGKATPFIAQDWRSLGADRGLSSFDQRQAFSFSAQYTTGMSVRGGALLRGWQGALYKGWTVLARLSAASGLPLTPQTLTVVPGSGVTGILRPSLTGAPLYAAPAGLFLNPAAYAAPAPGAWGDAGRNSITGPGQFNLDMALQRSFPLNDRLRATCRIEATNVLNHVVFPSWDTVVGSSQFGLPVAANPMRSVEVSMRVAF